MFPSPHVIIAGFGIPGRAVANMLDAAHLPYCVLELNAATVNRCARAGTHIVEGDVTDPDVLRKAHIDTAAAIVIAIPDEKAALEATQVARRLNRDIKIITRTHFVSAGMEAKSHGADAVIVAEQVVATELSKVAEQLLAPAASP
jgi:CPA2 family monovalent cation:H+ antiporter-2